MTIYLNKHGEGTILVLDHGWVTLHDHMGGDSRILEAARVSTGSGTKGEKADRKLLNFLLTHNHSSPFQHTTFTFIVKCPIFVQRQWARHRTWTYMQINEESARYKDLTDKLDFYVPLAEHIGRQPMGGLNKQGRDREVPDPQFQLWAQRMIDGEYTELEHVYTRMIAEGVARELARLVLPVGTYTSFYLTTDLWNLLHFLDLRTHEGAQWEMQEYAGAIRELARRVAPFTFECWEAKYGDQESA